MRRRRRRTVKKHRRSMKISTPPLGFFVIIFAAALIRLLYLCGVGGELEQAVLSAAKSEVFVYETLNFELERASLKTQDELYTSAVFSQSPVLEANEEAVVRMLSYNSAEADPAGTDPVEIAVPALIRPPQQSDDGQDLQEVTETSEEAIEPQIPEQTPETEPTPENSAGYVFSSEDAAAIQLSNNTSYDIDVEALLTAPVVFNRAGDEPTVLIIHTHSSESFTPSGKYPFELTDVGRTEDTEYNVVRLGSEIADIFESRGISVIHDTTINDYPTYSGSYTRTLAIIEKYLAQYPSIQIVLDIHRDSLADSAGNTYKTVFNADGLQAAQVMLVAGSDEGGLSHPLWMENLKLGLKLQAAMNQDYPGLARPLNLRQERFNQHATQGSLIVEIGCSGNTLDEALLAADYFADCASKLIVGLTEDSGA